jgi:hypothetical protein
VLAVREAGGGGALIEHYDGTTWPPGWEYEVVDYDHMTSWGSSD